MRVQSLRAFLGRLRLRGGGTLNPSDSEGPCKKRPLRMHSLKPEPKPGRNPLE